MGSLFTFFKLKEREREERKKKAEYKKNIFESF